MDDFDQPSTWPGFCPVCSQPANIWNDTAGTWECCYCNWKGRYPLREDPRTQYQPSHFKDPWE